ncbi:NALCN channel auxiliary factor 2 isoform 2-T2 [Liasis olivaceus]
MTSGAWMQPRENDAAAAAAAAAALAARLAPPNQPEKPCADSERAQKWRLSLGSLLFFTVLLSDHLWLCGAAGAQPRAQARSLAMSAPWAALAGGPRNHSEGPAPPAHPRCSAAGAPGRHLDLSAACSQRRLLQQGSLAAFPAVPLRLPAAAAVAAASSPQLDFLEEHFRNFRLPFCDTYTAWDLLLGMAGPESLDCSLPNLLMDFLSAAAGAQRGEACSSCLEAYQRLDQHAQEKYEEFELLLEKYLQAEDYSVRSCIRDCKGCWRTSCLMRKQSAVMCSGTPVITNPTAATTPPPNPQNQSHSIAHAMMPPITSSSSSSSSSTITCITITTSTHTHLCCQSLQGLASATAKSGSASWFLCFCTPWCPSPVCTAVED